MSFALQAGEPMDRAVLRALREQLDRALGQLASLEGEASEAVHEARKAVKRVRSLLRLLRAAIGNAEFALENLWFRDLGRRLSAVRDQQIVAESLDKLLAYAGSGPYAEAVAPVRAALVGASAGTSLADEELQEVVQAFRAARGRIDALAEGALGQGAARRRIRAAARRGLARFVRRCRRDYEITRRDPTTNHLHEWRKRVKDLYYATAFLTPARPKRLMRLAEGLDRLADHLGDEHDLSIVAELLHSDPERAGGPVPVALVLQLIGRRREELRTEAGELGGKLLALRPGAFSRGVIGRVKALEHERHSDEQPASADAAKE